VWVSWWVSGKWVHSPFIQLPLLWGWQYFNLETCRKVKTGKRHKNWKANVTEEYVELCHCGTYWMIRRCASLAGNTFLKSPSISLGVNGYAKLILRQRKCWVWGLMLQKNMIFDLKISLKTPHKRSTRYYTPMSISCNWTTNFGWCDVVADLQEGDTKYRIKSLIRHRYCWMA
jgi:hypothetical protein